MKPILVNVSLTYPDQDFTQYLVKPMILRKMIVLHEKLSLKYSKTSECMVKKLS